MVRIESQANLIGFFLMIHDLNGPIYDRPLSRDRPEINKPDPIQYQTPSDIYCTEHISSFNWVKIEDFSSISLSGLSSLSFSLSFSRSSKAGCA